MKVSVTKFGPVLEDVDEELAPVFEAVHGMRRLPLIREKMSIEIDGVPLAVSNALRRGVTDEILGRCLVFDEYDIVRTTEKFVNDHYISQRLRLIPLSPFVTADQVKNLGFEIHFRNNGFAPKTVYSGDMKVKGKLESPIFNPTFEIAVIQPGCELHVSGIRIAEGYGNKDISFAVARNAVMVPLDIDEFPREAVAVGELASSNKESSERWRTMLLGTLKMERWPESSTFLGKVKGQEKEIHDWAVARELKGEADGFPSEIMLADWCGYKKSSLLTDSRRQRITATFPAVPRAKPAGETSRMVLTDACRTIKSRLLYVQSLLEETGLESGHYIETKTETGTLLTLTVSNETHTIGNLLKKMAFEMIKAVEFVGYSVDRGVLKFDIRHGVPGGELRRLLVGVIRECFILFESIETQVRSKGLAPKK